MASQDDNRQFRFTRHCCRSLAALVAVVGLSGSVDAFEINTGDEDIVVNWDNTLRYTLADRVRGQSKDIINSPNHNDGDRNFNVGLVSSRFDLLSEMDVVVKKNFGVRLSGALWYDPVYSGKQYDNTFFSNHLVNGAPGTGVSNKTMRQFGGPDGELLDAFVFGKIDIGNVPLSVRAGRHTIYWGEAFFPAAGNNGISYGQSPIDMAKALAMPGVELKEIFRPLNQVSFTVQPTKEITVAGQYYLQWEANRFPETGSYLGMVDGLMNSGEFYYFPWGGPTGTGMAALNAGDRTPHHARDWGIKVAYSPEWLEGTTLGLHYRNFSDKMPQVLSSTFLAAPAPPLPTNFYNDYKSNIDLYGISFAKSIMGISVGSEISYRRNMPLTSQWFAPEGARGDTMHAVVNFLTLLPKTPVFDTGSAILEFAYGRWNRVTSGDRYFTGNPKGQNALGLPTNQGVGAATRDNSTVTINFVPEWKQVLPGVDLAMPINFSVGMHGNAATLTGGTRGTGSYSGGLSFDIFAKYKVDLTYASFFGGVYPGADGGIVPPGFESVPNGGRGASDAIALLRDRDLLSLTLKATF